MWEGVGVMAQSKGGAKGSVVGRCTTLGGGDGCSMSKKPAQPLDEFPNCEKYEVYEVLEGMGELYLMDNRDNKKFLPKGSGKNGLWRDGAMIRREYVELALSRAKQDGIAIGERQIEEAQKKIGYPKAGDIFNDKTYAERIAQLEREKASLERFIETSKEPELMRKVAQLEKEINCGSPTKHLHLKPTFCCWIGDHLTMLGLKKECKKNEAKIRELEAELRRLKK